MKTNDVHYLAIGGGGGGQVSKQTFKIKILYDQLIFYKTHSNFVALHSVTLEMDDLIDNGTLSFL